MKNNLTTFVDEMIDCINNPNNPKFFSVPQLLIERAKSIQQICTEIIHLNDPSILYTAFLDRIVIREPLTADWGFEIGRTCLGINLITRVDYNSPSAFPDKFDVGDEILEINGQSVIGWKRTSLLNYLNQKNQKQLFLKPERLEHQHHQQSSFSSNLESIIETKILLCKRPREYCSPQRFPPSNTNKIQDCIDNIEGDQETKRLTKLALDFKNKIGTDYSIRWHRNNNNNNLKENSTSKHNKNISSSSNHLTLRRVRSSSFTANVNSNNRRCSDCSLPQASRCISLLIPIGKQQLFRRASVWNESPPGTLHSPFKDSNSWLLLLASWGTENRLATTNSSNNNRPERINKRPPPLKGILESNGGGGGGISVVVDKGETDKDDLLFSNIEIVSENELIKINKTTTISSSFNLIIEQPEWSAPIKEITGISTNHLTSFENNNCNIIVNTMTNNSINISESPLSNIHAKIARFFYGELSTTTNSTSISTPLPSPINNSTSLNIITNENNNKNLSFSKNNSNYLINSYSSSFECKTPITPNSTKYSLDIPFSTIFNNKNNNESTICSSSINIDSPSYLNSNNFNTIIKTTTNTLSSSSSNRLAPLAEPDEIGDLLLTYVHPPIINSEINNEEKKIKILEGLILRELLLSEENKIKQQQLLLFRAASFKRKKRKRWIKNWGIIKDGGLFEIYSNQKSTEPEFLIDLSTCILTTKPEIETTKKHIFLLKNANQFKLHFSLNSNEELQKWLNIILLQQQQYNKNSFSPPPSQMIVHVVSNNNNTSRQSSTSPR